LHLSSKDRNLEGLDDMRIISSTHDRTEDCASIGQETQILPAPHPPKHYPLSAFRQNLLHVVTSLFSFISPFGFSNTMTPWRCIQKQTDGKPSLSAKKRGTEKTLKLLGDTLTDGGQACFASIASPREHFRHPSGCSGSQGQFPEWKHR
jgi:hypothetical protein